MFHFSHSVGGSLVKSASRKARPHHGRNPPSERFQRQSFLVRHGRNLRCRRKYGTTYRLESVAIALSFRCPSYLSRFPEVGGSLPSLAHDTPILDRAKEQRSRRVVKNNA